MLRSKKVLSIGLVLVLLLSILALFGCNQAGGISDNDQQTIIAAAIQNQTDGGVYKPDSYEVVKLKKGDIIYGMLPGQSAFYTDQATVD